MVPGNCSPCLAPNVEGATAKTYGVRTADVRSSLRVVVTAHNASGSAAGAASDPTAVVTATPSSTVTVTTPSRTNHAPRLTFLSLKRVGALIYSRFRVCDDSTARVSSKRPRPQRCAIRPPPARRFVHHERGRYCERQGR